MRTKLLFVALIVSLLTSVLIAQPVDKNRLPKLLNATNLGTEFWFTVPPASDALDSTGNFIRIFVMSSVQTLVTLEIPGRGVSMNKNTIPNDIIEFDLTPSQGQPYINKDTEPPYPEQVFPGMGIHLWSDQPLIVYCIVDYHSQQNHQSDGWLCIPTTSAGKQYIVSGYKVDAMFNAVWGDKMSATCGIVAPYNDTKVVFTLGGNAFSKTAGGMKPGDNKAFTLQKGDVWMVSSIGDEADLSGSLVVSSKPVQIVTGNKCANIPTGNQWCNYSAEMDIPAYAWDSVYHVPQITKRKYPSMIRIYARQPDTKIYRDGKQIGHLVTGGGVEGQAFLEQRIVGMDVKPHSAVFSGNKPIGITLLNPGMQEDNNSTSNIDPFFMAITSDNQFQKEITFYSPGNLFTTNYISLIFHTYPDGVMPNDLEFGYMNNGNLIWEKMDVKFPGIDELFYALNGEQYAQKLISPSKPGVYKIRAIQPFGVYLYGANPSGSYGFPASLGLKDKDADIHDSIPPVPTWSMDCNGNVNNGIITDYPDDASNRSNLNNLIMDKDSSYNYIFEYSQFIPGETRTASWKLRVIDPAKDARAIISFLDRKFNDTTIEIDYQSHNLTISQNSWIFGNISKNSPAIRHSFTIQNQSSFNEEITTLKLKYGDENFSIDQNGLSLPVMLQPQQSLNFDVIFNPNQIGVFTDSIGVGDSCIFFYKTRLRAYVDIDTATIDTPKIHVTDIDFGNINLTGGTISKEFTISNDGINDLIISGYSGPSNKVYSSDLPLVSSSAPLILRSNSILKGTISFKPDKIAAYNDSIVFYSNSGISDNICYINAVATSIDEKNTNADSYLNISTNPANNILNYSFKLKETGNVNLQIIDLKGNIVQNAEPVMYLYGEYEGILKINNLTPGIYFLKLSSKDIVLTKKFTIVK